MKPENIIIQGLWIGNELSLNEQLSIRSFLKNGHQYHLYVYHEVNNVPEGTIIKDANEILAESEIFYFNNYYHINSLAIFADWFRFHLLNKKGGWWADLDIVCIKPFDLDEDHVFTVQLDDNNNNSFITSGVIKFPANSIFGKRAIELLDSIDKETNQEWTLSNHTLISTLVNELNLEKFVRYDLLFSPILWHKCPGVFLHTNQEHINLNLNNLYSLHLYNERWKMRKINKNQRFDKNTLIELLREKYGL